MLGASVGNILLVCRGAGEARCRCRCGCSWSRMPQRLADDVVRAGTFELIRGPNGRTPAEKDKGLDLSYHTSVMHCTVLRCRLSWKMILA